MNFLKKAAFCYVAPVLSIFGMATAPLEIEAQCCDTAPCCIDWCSLVVPVLAGAAAGAGVAAAMNHKGKHGKRGETGVQGVQGIQGESGDDGLRGPPGDNPFIRDVTHSLTFNFSIDDINFDAEPGVYDPIIPYIGTPEGEILTGTPFSFVQDLDTTTSITKGSPVYGNYVFGLQVPAHDVEVTITFSFSVVTSDGRNDTVYPGSTVTSTITLAASASDVNVQLPNNFTYGPIGTVPQP